jgi:hypothetical protein
MLACPQVYTEKRRASVKRKLTQLQAEAEKQVAEVEDKVSGWWTSTTCSTLLVLLALLLGSLVLISHV